VHCRSWRPREHPNGKLPLAVAAREAPILHAYRVSMRSMLASHSTSTDRRTRYSSGSTARISDVHVLGNSKSDATCTKKGEDGKWYAPAPFENISVGWESYQHDTAGAHEAWIDDLVLDESPIGCP